MRPKKIAATALASACAALLLAGSAASTTFGVADDTGKYAPDGGASFFGMLNELGLTENRIAVLWDPAQPTTITEQKFLDKSIPEATRHGIDVILAVYPAKARALADTPNGVRRFAAFAAKVARRYRDVGRIICLNEGNQTRFHQPQFDAAGRGVAGALQEKAMAACYDALKRVDPTIDVIAFGFSPRGNDNPLAPNNISHSPLRLLKEIGAAYRASGRHLPIADDVAVHCYPNVNTDAPSVGYPWPNVGCVNLDRFKQAWWDAFTGTGQPVFREQGALAPRAPPPPSYVRLYVDEVGYQARIPTAKAPLYTGAENVPTIDDAAQAAWYRQLIAMAACDPNVALFNIWHAVDETALAGWQSGLVLADGTRRLSFTAVQQAVALNTRCRGQAVRWRHSEKVAAARVAFDLPRGGAVQAEEGFSYEAKIYLGTTVVADVSGTGNARTPTVFTLPPVGRGAYRAVVEVRAESNPGRVSTFTRGFLSG